MGKQIPGLLILRIQTNAIEKKEINVQNRK